VEDFCYHNLGKVVHECDTSSRWKPGSSYSIGDDEEYDSTITPQRTRGKAPPEDAGPLPAKCGVDYRFLFDSFWIQGGYWADDDFGGSVLKPNIERCGALTGWTF
jgi:hypothetical protein